MANVIGNHYSSLFTMAEPQYKQGLNYLTEHELNILNSFRSEIRRREWAGARLLAKYLQVRRREKSLFNSWNIVSWYEIEAVAIKNNFSSYECLIPKYHSGPPTVKYGFDTISISHKWPILCVGLAEYEPEFGVDIERVKKFDDDFCQYFFPYESVLCGEFKSELGYDSDRFFTMVWTLKEAYIKATKNQELNTRDIKISFQKIPESIIGMNNGMDELKVDRVNVVIENRLWHAEFISSGDYIASQLYPYKFLPKLISS